MMEAMTPMSHQQRVEAIARACHEANRAWCVAHGDRSQALWEDAEQWQRDSAIEGVQVAIDGATPEQQHQAWCDAKERDGVPYGELPAMQKVKDDLFGAIVRALAPALGLGRADG